MRAQWSSEDRHYDDRSGFMFYCFAIVSECRNISQTLGDTWATCVHHKVTSRQKIHHLHAACSDRFSFIHQPHKEVNVFCNACRCRERLFEIISTLYIFTAQKHIFEVNLFANLLPSGGCRANHFNIAKN